MSLKFFIFTGMRTVICWVVLRLVDEMSPQSRDVEFKIKIIDRSCDVLHSFSDVENIKIKEPFINSYSHKTISLITKL